MELESLKQDIFRWVGWLSVVIGLIVLAIANISILSGYDVPLSNQFSLLLFLSFLFAIIALFKKHSRPLGLWGLLISLYFIFFLIVIFFIGWTINPFP
ncbi:hypothetical protein ACFOZY_14400 [Chungangia koreensis]|uniref:Uncharacterized protein n=1 Tax=Chungangia koreensis TaxID=752657 RepID=A0ABV8X835_9LACT